jgi:hypothetical protein
MFAGVPIEGNSRTEGIRLCVASGVPGVLPTNSAAHSAAVSVLAGMVPEKRSRYVKIPAPKDEICAICYSPYILNGMMYRALYSDLLDGSSPSTFK